MRKSVLLLAAIALAMLLASGVAMAVVSKLSGGAIDQVRVAREDNTNTPSQTTSSTGFANVPGASVRITVPEGQQGLILARFSAESDCYRSGTAGPTPWCSVKIVAQNASGTTTLEPDDGDFAFDNTNQAVAGNGPGRSHSMDRSALLGPGTYTVVVQYRVSASSVTFELDDWSLTVEKAKVSAS